MRTTPRRRREISPARVRLIAPVFRYSYSRDAYILRGIGRHVGPVFRVTHRLRAPRPPRQPLGVPDHDGAPSTSREPVPSSQLLPGERPPAE